MTKLASLTVLLSCLITACGAIEQIEDPQLPTDEPPVGDEPPVDEPPVDEPPVDEPPVDEVRIAPFDNDSAQQPAENVFLSPTGNRSLTRTDEVSAPTGDGADFIAFRLPNNSNPLQRVTITLDCAITGEIAVTPRAEIFADGVRNGTSVACNAGPVQVTVDNTKLQTVQLAIASDTAVHVDYTLDVSAF